MEQKQSKYARKFGAFWEREGQSGPFLSGQIEIGEKKLNVILFKNNTKAKENFPDWELFLSAKEEESVMRAIRSGSLLSAVKGKGSPVASPKKTEPVTAPVETEEEYPF